MTANEYRKILAANNREINNNIDQLRKGAEECRRISNEIDSHPHDRESLLKILNLKGEM